MVRVYRIRNWKKFFEKSQSKEVRNAKWVPVPNSFEGRGFKRLMSRPDGTAIYGAWVLLLEIASKCPVRGELVRDGIPLTCEDFALMTGGQVEAFRTAIEVLSQPEIGWIEAADWECAGSALGVDSHHAGSALGACSQHAGRPLELQDRTREDRTSPAQTAAQEGLDTAVAGNSNGTMAALSSPTPATEPGHGADQPIKPAPESTKPKSDRYDGSVIWATWVDLHRARGLQNPARLGPDVGAARKLATVIPHERLAEVLAAFLDDADSFLEKRGHGLRDLSGRLNSYLNGAGGETIDQAVDRIAAELRTKRMAGEETFNEL